MIPDEYLSVEGPIERCGGRLVFRVPLNRGGERLKLAAGAVAYEEGGDLLIAIPDWLTERMKLREGTEIHLDDRWGKLNIARML